MARARVVAGTAAREYEFVRAIADATYALREPGGDVIVFEESSPRERIEFQCSVCATFSANVIEADNGDFRCRDRGCWNA